MLLTMKLKAGRFRLPVQYVKTHGRIFMKFGFNRALLNEIKSMEGSMWHDWQGATYQDLVRPIFKSLKVWSVKDCPRNRFQLDYLQGNNPYAPWENVAYGDLHVDRPLYSHQIELLQHALQTHFCIFAAEMGIGKTLAAIELMERSGFHDWYYIGPKSAIASVRREFRLWKCKVEPEMLSYPALVKRMKFWPEGLKAPRGVIFDESSKVKTPTAQRSQAAQHLADTIREEHGSDGFVILMSGSPAPRSPSDWWSQCEIACPGFLREGNRVKFENRLGIFEDMESSTGATFKKRVTWLDDPDKCAECGEPRDDICHAMIGRAQDDHPFKKSNNEVAALYRRMKGLVIVKFKKDCLDLPEKVYRTVVCKPLPSILRAAKVLVAKTARAAQAIILLRELSDGFQYVQVESGSEGCPVCLGKGKIVCPETDNNIICDCCGGSGTVTRYKREAKRIPCPKDDALKDLLDEHHDVGRLVIYAGFQGSVDRCVQIALGQKWTCLRWDGRGIKMADSDGPIVGIDPLDMFNDTVNYTRVAFIAQPGAAGMGLNLTVSPTIVYYSNDFNAESRIQSEDRIHRPGCLGAQIIDIVHLPTDEMVLKNLKEKRKIQDMTMGELERVLKEEDDDDEFER